MDAFQEANRNSTYPMPSFAGKKGEKPEDHTLRFEDYVQHYDIAPARQSQAFMKTLTGKARVWADTTKDGVTLPVYQAIDPTVRADVEKSLKHLFLTRFAIQGRTPEALYAEWQNLSYDPAKDDIEDFVRDIKKLAEQLGYGDTAALMAVRGALPLDLQNLTVNMNDLETVKKLLIKIFDNPKMKQNYAKKEPTASTPAAGAFSQTIVIGEPHDKGMSYFLSRIDELGSKVDRLKIRDQKARKPPYKPQMTPKCGRGGGRRQTNNYSRGRGDRMTIDRNRTRGFAVNPGTKEPLEEDKEDLTKAQTYLDPELLEGPRTKTIKGVSIAKKLDILWTDVIRKRATDERPQKKRNCDYYRTLPMDKRHCPYLTQKLTPGMTTQRTNTLTS